MLLRKEENSMKKKIMLCGLVLLLSACDLAYNPSTSDRDGSSMPGLSSIENSENSISSENSMNSESSSSSSGMDISMKEYYKSLVNRDDIHYTTYPKNDPTHQVRSLEIFQLNDTHGAYYDDDSVTGIARVKKCIDENTNDPYACVKIANGDMMQGTAFSNLLLGEPAVAALNEMNFDAFVIGNHEFDWMLDNLSVYKDGNDANGELKCPFLGANIVDSEGNRPEWIEPYTIVNKGDVKVGIIGIIGDGLEHSISKVSIGDYHFTSTTEAVNQYCKVLKDEEKVDVIIVASHAHDEAQNQVYVNNNDIDCIINGHDHQIIEEYVARYDGKTIPVIESNTKNITIGKVTLALDANKKMSSFEMEHFNPSRFECDANLDSIMNVYYSVIATYQDSVIGYKEYGFSRDELSIVTCNYVADKYDADLAIMNTGGVRCDIYSSNITNGMIYEAFPFDNELYIATMTGQELQSMISYSYMSNYYYNDTGIGQGVAYHYTSIQANKKYKIVTVDYVATKDYMQKYFDTTHGLIMTGDYIRDCAIENIQQNYKK